MEFYAAERKKELIPFAMAWMELESIKFSEFSPCLEPELRHLKYLKKITLLEKNDIVLGHGGPEPPPMLKQRGCVNG